MPGNAYNVGQGDQPDRYLQAITSYRETILTLFQMLIQTSWPELKSTSTVFITVEKSLRDTIDNLERLGEDPERNRVEIGPVLKALYRALKELDGASMLADDSKVQVRLQSLDKVEICREYLKLAVDLMNF